MPVPSPKKMVPLLAPACLGQDVTGNRAGGGRDTIRREGWGGVVGHHENRDHICQKGKGGRLPGRPGSVGV